MFRVGFLDAPGMPIRKQDTQLIQKILINKCSEIQNSKDVQSLARSSGANRRQTSEAEYDAILKNRRCGVWA